VIANGSPVGRADHLAGLSFRELRAYGDALTKDLDLRPPIQIVSFEV
jgi:hypothetical protein